MTAGDIVRDGWGRYWRVRSTFYAPWLGIRLNMEGPRRSCHVNLSVFMSAGGRLVRQAGVVGVGQ